MNGISLTCFTFGLLACNLITWTCLIILYLVNRNAYKNSRAIPLSKKYQITENIRTVWVLIVFVVITAIRNTINITILLVYGFYLRPKNLWYETIILDHVMHLTIAIYVLLYPLPLIFSHKDLKKIFKENILKIKNEDVIHVNTVGSNVLGDQIIMNFDGDGYFRDLEHQWEVARGQQRQLRPNWLTTTTSNRVGNSNEAY
uniref:Uncharacterized protein n=1 Tax=Acrobeloides nanus TaxID=290746 RepID=A0A914E905_9BILA